MTDGGRAAWLAIVGQGGNQEDQDGASSEQVERQLLLMDGVGLIEVRLSSLVNYNSSHSN